MATNGRFWGCLEEYAVCGSHGPADLLWLVRLWQAGAGVRGALSARGAHGSPLHVSPIFALLHAYS